VCPLRVTVHVLNQPLLFHVFSLPNAQLIKNAGRQLWALWLADSNGTVSCLRQTVTSPFV